MLKQQAQKPKLQIKFNWKIATCVIFMLAVLVRLGFWQLDRAQQKSQIQNDHDTRRLAKPVAIESLNLVNKKALKHTKITLQGHYDNTKSILVSNQIFQGRPGFEVITLFELTSNNQTVLVSRGWISADYRSQKSPEVTAIQASQQLVGEIYVPSDKSFFLPQKIDQSSTWPLRVHHFEISHISQLLKKPILPFIVRLDPNNPGVLDRHWRTTRLQSKNSTSYAIQWFAMALILIVVVIIKSTNILEILGVKKKTF